MEKNFLGKGGSDPGAGNCNGGRVDSALPVNLAVRWPLRDKAPSMQQFMPFKSQPEEKPHNVLPVSSTPFQTISTAGFNIKACIVQAPQIAFGLDWNSDQQVSIPASVSQASSLITMNCPLFKDHGTSNGPNLTVSPIKPKPFLSLAANNNSLLGAGVGSFTSRKVMKPSPTTRQLTIFYAGSLNVYDDVPWDKAQAVMLMACEGCKTTANAVHSIAEARVLPLTKESNFVSDHMMSSCPVLSSTLSLSSNKGNLSWSGPMATDDRAGVKRVGSTVLTIEDDASKTMSTSIAAATAATILPKAVPQARKASLARFLEKRKERVSSTTPYSFDNMSEKSIAPDINSSSSNCSIPQDYRTCNKVFSQLKGRANDYDENIDSPSTNLEM